MTLTYAANKCMCVKAKCHITYSGLFGSAHITVCFENYTHFCGDDGITTCKASINFTFHNTTSEPTHDGKDGHV